jgi:dihydroneopterin aldolase
LHDDRIAIVGIRAHGRHGANPGERDAEQAFDLDIEVEADLTRARATDKLSATIDYAEVHALAVRIVREHSYVLLERLADEICRALLEIPRVLTVSVTIAKPRLLDGATPSIRVRATREDLDHVL